MKEWAPEYASAEAPEPIVDLRVTRNAALDAYEHVKQAARTR